MKSSAELIHNYILAKDGNRPYLMKNSFAEHAVLEMVVSPGTIAFPSLTTGVEAMMDVLVRQFGKTYENIYTLCLANPPQKTGDSYACKWLVVMSEKESGAVRFGAGNYDWLFQKEEPYLVEKLTITIKLMQTLPKETLDSFMDWISNLPYPWCPVEIAINNTPKVDGVQAVIDYISHNK